MSKRGKAAAPAPSRCYSPSTERPAKKHQGGGSRTETEMGITAAVGAALLNGSAKLNRLYDMDPTVVWALLLDSPSQLARILEMCNVVRKGGANDSGQTDMCLRIANIPGSATCPAFAGITIDCLSQCRSHMLIARVALPAPNVRLFEEGATEAIVTIDIPKLKETLASLKDHDGVTVYGRHHEVCVEVEMDQGNHVRQWTVPQLDLGCSGTSEQTFTLPNVRITYEMCMPMDKVHAWVKPADVTDTLRLCIAKSPEGEHILHVTAGPCETFVNMHTAQPLTAIDPAKPCTAELVARGKLADALAKASTSGDEDEDEEDVAALKTAAVNAEIAEVKQFVLRRTNTLLTQCPTISIPDGIDRCTPESTLEECEEELKELLTMFSRVSAAAGGTPAVSNPTLLRETADMPVDLRVFRTNMDKATRLVYQSYSAKILQRFLKTVIPAFAQHVSIHIGEDPRVLILRYMLGDPASYVAFVLATLNMDEEVGPVP